MTSTANFVVCGDFVTEHFRTRVLEHEWQRALNEIMETLEGFTFDHAVEVLSGQMKLTGTDDLEMVKDEDSAPYLSELDWQYGHLWNDAGTWWEAYAIVTNYGDRDLPLGSSKPPYITENMHGTAKRTVEIDVLTKRAQHYTDNNGDRIIRLPVPDSQGIERPMMALFRQVSSAPVWIKGLRTAQEAVAKARQEGHVTLRGHSQWYPMEEREQITRNAKEYGRRMAELKKAGVWPDQDVDDGDSFSIEKQTEAVAKIPSVEEYLEDLETAEENRANVTEYRQQILNYCHDNDVKLVEHDFGDDIGVVSIPELPLLAWALERTDSPFDSWEPVCPRHMKMYNDNRYHTDWMVGAGIDLDKYKDAEFKEKSFELMAQLQDEHLEHKLTILVKGKPNAFGEIVHPKIGDVVGEDKIAIIPSAGTEWYETVRGASGIICERGGAMSHLAVVGLEEALLVCREPGALKKYSIGTLMTIDGDTGIIEVS